ncbi:unnamed protein product [Mytilus edulis]|uniref:DZIP3-like HEPN domain-containing protein n=1 Tax=Mytilus edulis TaxID=6550 RepID=A0A8S3SXJ8_MYTED|nr:unnamed protein product [Mytilus edulis]
MECLLKNFTDLDIQDSLPRETNLSTAADISRIKFYRNYIVYTVVRVTDIIFLEIWNCVVKAILRLVPDLKSEIDALKTATLFDDIPFWRNIKKHNQHLLTVSQNLETLDDHSTTENPDFFPYAGTTEDFHKLLSTGTYESFENRVFLCGSCACGKSTLASVLIGSPIPLTWKSTDGLVIHFGRNGINLDTYAMVPLNEGNAV